MDNYELTTNILFQAEDFYETFKRCLTEISYQSSSGRGTIVSIPAIVNGAFALELYFNFLSNRYHISHSLMKLYSFIPEDTKGLIKDKTYSKLKTIYQYEECSFEKILKDIDNLFVEWRYTFKKNKTQAYFGNAINRYISALEIILEEVSIISKEAFSVYNIK